jgi:YebC/PmpR family DNA-binding regulatory protein
MSGHSKWHTIKHKKGALDAKRGKLFTRIAKEIEIAARNGGDPDANARLRTAIQAARSVSMPSDNIQRAIKRGTGELEGVTLEEVMYEGYGPGGSAMLIACVTDNRNRTVSDIRSMMSKNNGNMAEPGAVSWMFKRKSQIVIEKEKANEEQLMNLALEAGGDDVKDDGEVWTLLSDPNSHDAMVAAVQAAGIETVSAEIGYFSENLVKLEGGPARSFMKLHGLLDDYDDVQNIWDNSDIDPAEIEA